MAKQKQEMTAWSFNGDSYTAVAGAAQKLPAGNYEFVYTNYGLGIKPTAILSDSFIELPDTPSQSVIHGIKTFWEKEELYRKHHILYKRGILLHGPPGSGKTATLIALANFIKQEDGIVFICNTNMRAVVAGLGIVRSVEKNRRVMCIMEELEEQIESYESVVLSLLDGESTIDGVVNVATTNYMDKLPARIINRPSRFDECVAIDMPTKRARRVYLKHLLPEIDETTLETWVTDTKGLSIAHVKELAVAVSFLGQGYNTVLARLKSYELEKEDKSLESDDDDNNL